MEIHLNKNSQKRLVLTLHPRNPPIFDKAKLHHNDIKTHHFTQTPYGETLPIFPGRLPMGLDGLVLWDILWMKEIRRSPPGMYKTL